MKNDRNQVSLAVCEVHSAGSPALLQCLYLCPGFSAVRRLDRREQCAESGGTVIKKNLRMPRNGIQIHKKQFFPLRLRLIRAHTQKFAEQAVCSDAAVISHEVSILFRPYVLHIVHIVFCFGRCGAFKSVGQPRGLDCSVKLIDTCQKRLYAHLCHAAFFQKPGKQGTRIRIRQIRICHGFQCGLRRLTSALPLAACHTAEHRADHQQAQKSCRFLFPLFHKYPLFFSQFHMRISMLPMFSVFFVSGPKRIPLTSSYYIFSYRTSVFSPSPQDCRTFHRIMRSFKFRAPLQSAKK